MQLPLPLARASDAETSHLAASSARELQARHIALIYSALLDAGMVGMTKDELAAVTGLDATQVARLVCNSFTLEYRRACIKFWREHYGDAFALEVEKEVAKAWGKRRKVKRA